ncbi:hypothetical protein N7535_002273 [Penicillium sp. DV-2018c]|nr:hypothetical protein N7461_004483 [Penicillium sp. DV-2018c]KAJ5583653.1 hypothetical protein N7535_002273 [Penicillium sp. DV-2018c]
MDFHATDQNSTESRHQPIDSMRNSNDVPPGNGSLTQDASLYNPSDPAIGQTPHRAILIEDEEDDEPQPSSSKRYKPSARVLEIRAEVWRKYGMSHTYRSNGIEARYARNFQRAAWRKEKRQRQLEEEAEKRKRKAAELAELPEDERILAAWNEREFRRSGFPSSANRASKRQLAKEAAEKRERELAKLAELPEDERILAVAAWDE